ncbi:hypothetical protein LguiA_007687 [Lonicera macranthoides]
MAESSLTFEYRSITLFINFCGEFQIKLMFYILNDQIPHTNIGSQGKKNPQPKVTTNSKILEVTTLKGGKEYLKDN